MNATQVRHSPARTPGRSLLRWLVSFVGYPVGGLAAELIVGPVDGPGPALIGGAITGGLIATAQWIALRPSAVPAGRWIVGGAAGLAAGLAIGSVVVGYAHSAGDLMIQGVCCGLAVGAGQSVALWGRFGALTLLWPATLGVAWPLGWLTTSAIGVDVQAQYTVFGSAGAVVVTGLTAWLPRLLLRAKGSAR